MLINSPLSHWLINNFQTPSNQIFCSAIVQQPKQVDSSCGEDSLHCALFSHANQYDSRGMERPQRRTKVCALVITHFKSITVLFLQGVTQFCKGAMGLPRELSILLVFFSLTSTNVSGDQVRLTGEEFIIYEPRKAANPRLTEIKLRFRTIHTNGLLMYSSTRSGYNDFLQLDIYHGQVR